MNTRKLFVAFPICLLIAGGDLTAAEFLILGPGRAYGVSDEKETVSEEETVSGTNGTVGSKLRVPFDLRKDSSEASTFLCADRAGV